MVDELFPVQIKMTEQGGLVLLREAPRSGRRESARQAQRAAATASLLSAPALPAAKRECVCERERERETVNTLPVMQKVRARKREREEEGGIGSGAPGCQSRTKPPFLVSSICTKREQLETFFVPLPRSHGQNLAVTGLHVPY